MTRRIGRYEVLAELGRGGFGHVYRGLDPTVGRPVAIKTLIASGEPDMLTRFRNEAAVSGRLRHPNIVTIFDFGEHEGTPYIVMELLEGQDLQRVISNGTPVSLLDKLKIMTQIAAGLGHAHTHGIIHRDVKPANAMLLADGGVKIMDFGIALITQATNSRLTPRGAMIGTFRYMAPEQFRNAQSDARSDIFAYGLIFYELLSGIHPFDAADAGSLMYNILSVEPVAIEELVPQCPAELHRVVRRLLQKDPDARYQSFDDVLFDLEPPLLDLRRQRAQELLGEAQTAKVEKRFEAAQELVRQILELTPGEEAARRLREEIQIELRRQALRPRVDDLIQKGRDSLAAGNAAEAVQRFESAIRLDPIAPEIQGLIQEARAAVALAKEVSRLTLEAESALTDGDPPRAARLARQVLEIAPADTRAKQILSRAESVVAEERRKARLADGLGRARRLIDIRSWDEASKLLAKINQEFSGVAEITALAEELRAGWAKEERERLLSSGLAAARQQVQKGDLAVAATTLEALAQDYPESADVQNMLGFVRSEIEAQNRREFVKQSIERARELAARREFESATKILDGALSRYSADPELQRERRSIAVEHREATRRSAAEKAITEASGFRSQGRLAEALRSLDGFLVVHGSDPAVSDLRAVISKELEEAERAAELHDFIRRAKELMAHGRVEDATTFLQAPPSHLQDDSEINQLLGEANRQLEKRAERKAALQAALTKTLHMRQIGSFGEAFGALEAFENKHGPDEEIERTRKEVERLERETRDAAAADLVAQATKLLSRDPAEAIAVLGAAPGEIRRRAEIQNLERAAAQALEEQRAREAEARLQRERAEAQALAEQRARETEAKRQRERAEAQALAEQRAREDEARLERERAEALALAREAEAKLQREQAEAAALAREAEAKILQEAREQLEVGRFDQALALLNGGIARYPGRPDLLSARQAALSAQEKYERERSRQAQVAKIGVLIANEKYEEAATALAAALSRNSADEELLRLRTEVEASLKRKAAERIEKELQTQLARAREAMANNPAAAIPILESLLQSHADRQDVSLALAEAREGARQQRRRAVFAEIERFCQREEFDGALRELGRGDLDAQEAAAWRARVEALREQALQRAAAEAIRIASNLRDQFPARALKGLEDLAEPLRSRPEIQAMIQECGAAVVALDRRAAIASIEDLRSRGKLGKAAERQREAVARFGPDAELSEVLTRIEADSRARETAPRKTWLGRSILAGAIAAAAVVGALVWMHAHQASAPVAALMPAEIRTDPAGASVSLGTYTCQTPNCKFDLAPGTYPLRAQLNGYEPAEQSLIVGNDRRLYSLDLALKPIVAPPRPGRPTGTLTVQAGIPDALVLIDSAPAGRTDSNGRFSSLVEATRHTVRVEKNGYQTPMEQRATIAENRSQSILVKLLPQSAKLELRGAPGGVEIRANGTLLGRTDDSGTFSAAISPGGYLLRITEGSTSRDIDATLTPGQQMMLDWLNVAPVKAPVPSPKVDIAEQDWEGARSGSDPARLQAFIDKYPNGPHTSEAQSQLGASLWARTNQNDPQSLQAYIKRFPNDPRAREAQTRLVELAWNGVDKKDMQALRTFLEQNPDSPHKVEIQSLLDLLEKKRVEAERISLEQARQAAQQQAEAKAILAALDRFNLAFEKQKPGELKAIWPGVPKKYLDAMTTPTVVVEIRLTPTAAPVVSGDSASVVCSADSTTTVRGGRPTSGHKSVKVTLRNVRDRWEIVDIPDPGAPTN
jgi:serine/threonine-protein kinase